MGILGLTHEANGATKKQLPVTIKIAIGEIVKENGKSRPVRLDHFEFKRKKQEGQRVSWVSAPDLTKLFGENPTEIGIIFTSDNFDEVLRTEPVYQTTYGYRCRGKLVQIDEPSGAHFAMKAVRRTKEHPDGEPWPGKHCYQSGPMKSEPLPPCGENCPDLIAKRCKYSGDLYFRLEKYPVFGAICRIHTNSPKSIVNLSNGLAEIQEQNGGRLAGVRATLRVAPHFTWFRDTEGEKHATVIYVLSLEARGPNHRPEEHNSNGVLGSSHATQAENSSPHFEPCVAVESEEERAEEIAEEFYPENVEEGCEELEPAQEVAQSTASEEQRSRINELFSQLRYNEAKANMLLGQYAGKVHLLEQRLRDALRDKVPQKKTTSSKANVDVSQGSEPRANGNKNGVAQLALYSSSAESCVRNPSA